jgi:hypothetical protein
VHAREQGPAEFREGADKGGGEAREIWRLTEYGRFDIQILGKKKKQTNKKTKNKE